MANESIKERVQRGVENGVLTQEQAEYIVPELKQEKIKWNVKDFRTWQFIVSDVLTKDMPIKKDGIGQYLDDGFCRGIAEYMQKKWSDKLFIEQKQEADNSQSDTSSDSSHTPKFKVGDIIIVNDGSEAPFKVNKVLEETYELIGLDEEGDDYHFPISKTDNEYRPWTIQDAKDGDVIVCEDFGYTSLMLFESFSNGRISLHCWYNCWYNSQTNNFHINTDVALGKDANIYPATKEQRNLLFQKMKEAGYEWDAAKKELRKIEQNLDWSEEDIVAIDCAVEALSKDLPSLAASIERLKSLKSSVQPQPKPEWSKDDEERLNEVIETLNIVQANRRHTSRTHYSEDAIKKDIEWLKSRRIGDQPQWNPSDEQMKQLDAAINAYAKGSKTYTVLCSLYDKLKMLRDNE